ncbi:hypothetical protein [Haloechinothrix sp. LS1_15]|uniref:hypothetical protein n=1 Tax=Haloechinothrix sp. LS1_15 TaxID=2652248 RepID=UPI002945B286|nr:hypothetical protein [Haloechinothrix sp. LS1_15]MDV6012490.1 hypothetical protein [Haloechinothrix sp. LS1_15]
MSASTEGSDAAGMSEEQIKEYKERLRAAPAEQVVTEMLGTVLHAAEVKLGRRDARLLIDLSSVMLEHVRDYVSADLATQVDRALGQLRLGQVNAERSATDGQVEDNDLDRVPTAPTQGSGQQQEPSPARSKLWVPGQ